MSAHQYAMVIDLNKCIGCQTCTMACKKQWTDGDGQPHMYWNNVETWPGAGYPRGWRQARGGFVKSELDPGELLSADDYGVAWEYDYHRRLFEGGKAPIMPHRPAVSGPNWDEDVGAVAGGQNYYVYVPRLCNHCTHPACLEACPRSAIYKRAEDGIVLIDQERCRGYRQCVRACPYKKIYFNEVAGKSQKCIFCYPRLEQGRVNACAAQCVGRIRFVGLLDDPRSPVHQIVVAHRAALPLMPWRGTGPNVYYVPPFAPPRPGRGGASLLADPRFPTTYLVELFGEEVVPLLQRLEGELKRAQAGGRSDLLELLIGRTAQDRFRVVDPRTLTAGGGPAGGHHA
jgi:DMSO reductase family type II enzyme iron-sulfur subunit